MRVVLDTNVLVSALIFPGGTPELVYRLALEGRIELISSRILLAELGSLLDSTFGWEPARVEQAVAQLTRIATLVEPTAEIGEVTVDPTDNRVLEAATAGGVAVIVSGDRHLLAFETWRGVVVQKPADFVQSFSDGI